MTLRLEQYADEVSAKYLSGLTTTELGRAYKVDPSTVSNFLKAKGVVRRPKGRRHTCFEYIDAHGYRRIKRLGHPLADKDGFVKEHQLVFHEAHGKPPRGFHIHHVDGNKLNNALSNLTLLTASEHASQERKKQIYAGTLSDPRVALAKRGHCVFQRLYPMATPVADVRWYADYDFCLEDKSVEVKTSREYHGRYHFSTGAPNVDLLFCVLVNASDRCFRALLFDRKRLPTSLWLGGRRGSKHETHALALFDLMDFSEIPKANNSNQMVMPSGVPGGGFGSSGGDGSDLF